MNPSSKQIRILKVIVFVACLGPVFHLLWKGFNQLLGANPIEVVTHATGDWTLIFLLVTLAITPARKLLEMPWLIRFRRMTGLFAFFYGCLHFTTYIWLDKFFDVHEMLTDVGKRKFITVGFTAFLVMIPLAATSTKGWITRLGGKRWNRLHRLIYASAALGVIHYLWLVKADIRRPVYFGIVLGFLLLFRVGLWISKKLEPSALAKQRRTMSET